MSAISKDIRAISKVIAIVTGGASGLGKATAARLVQNGACVTIADLLTSKGKDVAKELGEKCTFVPTNVSVLLDKLGLGIRDCDVSRRLSMGMYTFTMGNSSFVEAEILLNEYMSL